MKKLRFREVSIGLKITKSAKLVFRSRLHGLCIYNHYGILPLKNYLYLYPYPYLLISIIRNETQL